MLTDNQDKAANNLVVTGSSGFVAAEVIPRLSTHYRILGIDKTPGNHTTCVKRLSSTKNIKRSEHSNLSVLHLAAARFDHGATAAQYYRDNVEETRQFLKKLDPQSVHCFVHVSSVAAFDGSKIKYSERLSCDDAYRCTKHLQERLITDWALENKVRLYVLYPSAIFSQDIRLDTNIGKLQKLTNFLPVAPKLSVKKSLTYLPNFAAFIENCLNGHHKPGFYLTLEQPTLTVTEIISSISKRKLIQVNIPFLQSILKVSSYFLWLISVGGRFDLKLTPNRVVKLFSNTEYIDTPFEVNTISYNEDGPETAMILKSL